jgi:BON domain
LFPGNQACCGFAAFRGAQTGVVRLTGRVFTFYEKQLCNQCCGRVAGVRQLINAVQVIGTMPGAAVVA